MIDHATINLISRFASRTHLTADLSHTNPDAGAGSRQHDNVAIGNYHYDDGSCHSLDEEQGRILDTGAVSMDGTGPGAQNMRSAYSASGANSMSLNRRINQPNSAINQLRKVLQSVHLNQRVVSTTITFNTGTGTVRHLTPVTIDGVTFEQDFSTPIQKIEVSRVFKYQGVSANDILARRNSLAPPASPAQAKQ